MKHVIELKDIKKIYHIGGEDFAALAGITLNIEEGEFAALMGPSGSGKSTLMNILGCLDRQTSGSYKLGGKEVAHLGDDELAVVRNQHIGFVFQNFNLLSRISALDNVALPLVYAGVGRRERTERAMEKLKSVGLETWAHHKPNELSGGQRQRVAIGRAIVRDPKVFLMDEPLSNLDAKLRNQMRAEIIKLREKIDTTFIYVTHDQVEAMTLGDRIVIMRDGFIQQIGTPQEVFNHPANLFVAGFIGTPQMNFFEDCRLTKNGDAYSVTVMGHTLPLTAEQNAKLAAAGAESRTVTVGVRPVHVTVGGEGIDAQIDVSELMGSELHLHMTAGGKDVVAVVQTANLDPNAYARHTAVRFSFEPRLIHLFAPETEKNLI